MTEFWVVLRLVRGSQGSVSCGVELFESEEDARHWAEVEPLKPNERRLVQRKLIRPGYQQVAA